MADEATMKAFRQLEAELDAHYQTLPLFGRPLGNAIYCAARGIRFPVCRRALAHAQ